MTSSPRALLGLILALSLLPAACLSGKELHPRLREASELYRTDRLEEARTLALTIQRAFPDHFETLILLLRIDIARSDRTAARGWLRAAARQNPTHPLVLTFIRLFQEEDHQRGTPLTEPGPDIHPDPMSTARSFQRAWFAPMGPWLFPRWPVMPPPPAMAQPATTSRLLHSIARMAADAQNQGLSLKAYLLFTQLAREEPENAQFRLGQAIAAHALGRFQEARNLLLPLERLPAGAGLRQDQQETVHRLQQDIITKLSLPIPRYQSH